MQHSRSIGDTELHADSAVALRVQGDAAALAVQHDIDRARRSAPKDGYTALHVACVYALLGDADLAMRMLKEVQSRRYHIKSELMANSDLDLLRGRPEFRQLAE